MAVLAHHRQRITAEQGAGAVRATSFSPHPVMWPPRARLTLREDRAGVATALRAADPEALAVADGAK